MAVYANTDWVAATARWHALECLSFIRGIPNATAMDPMPALRQVSGVRLIEIRSESCERILVCTRFHASKQWYDRTVCAAKTRTPLVPATSVRKCTAHAHASKHKSECGWSWGFRTSHEPAVDCTSAYFRSVYYYYYYSPTEAYGTSARAFRVAHV